MHQYWDPCTANRDYELVRIYTDKSCQDCHHADADQNDLYLTHQSDKMRSVKKIKYEIEVQKKHCYGLIM